MRRILLSFAALAALAAAPPPVLRPGYTRDANGMCHSRDGIFADCKVAAPAYTYVCRDNSYTSSKIMKSACKTHGGVRKVL